MNRIPRSLTRLVSAALASACGLPFTLAQTTPTPPSPATAPEVVQLTPFTVSAEGDTGYRAKESLEGSRLRISLDDISVPMDIITPEVLEDFNITRQEDLFDIVSNMEDRGDFFLSAVYESGASYRIRGFVGVTSLRNFLKGKMSFDSYNSTRFIASKGPNSILFGAGPGGGSVSFFTKRYEMGARNSGAVKASADSLGSVRGEMNLTRSLIKNKVGIHVAAFNENKKFEIKPSYEDRHGYYLSAAFRPFEKTLVNASYETRSEHVYRGGSNYTTLTDNYSRWQEVGAPANLTTGIGGARAGLANRRSNLQLPDGSVLNNQDLWNWGMDWFSTARPTIVDGNYVDLAGASWSDSTRDTAQTAGQRNFPAGIWPRDVGPTGLNGGAEVQAEALDLSIEQKVTNNFYLMLAAGRITSSRLLLPHRIRNLRIDGNRFMPDRTLNPNYGRYYLELENPGTLDTFNDTDTVTLTAAYELDLQKHSKFFGKHNVAVMYSDVSETSQTIRQRMTLVKTPASASYVPVDAQNASQSLAIRQYVDLARKETMPDYRYILSQGYDNGGYRWENIDGIGPSAWRRVDNVSQMFVLQSSFLRNRVITNIGYREEDVKQYVLNFFNNPALSNRQTAYLPYTKEQAGDTALLQSLRTNDLRPTVFPTVPWESKSGVARNAGLIVKVTPTIALVANKASNLSPNVGRVGIFGVPLPTSNGESEDYGIRFNLFRDRMRVEYTRYTTAETNQELQTNQLRVPEDQANDLWQMMIQRGVKTTNVFLDYAGWDTRDFVSRGHEITISGDPIRNLSTRVAVSYNEQVASNLGGTFMPWWKENLPDIEAFVAANPNAINTDNNSANAVTRLQSAKDELLLRDQLEGIPNVNAALWAVKALAKYRFTDGKLRGNEVGANVAWRSKMKSNFFINPDGSIDLSRPYYSEATLFTHVFWSYSRRLKLIGNDVRWRFQLNVNNVFDRHTTIERNFFNIDRTNYESPTVFTGLVNNPGRVFSVSSTFSF